MSLRVLVTDDSYVMRAMISRILMLTGLPFKTILTAKNGYECLNVLGTNQVDILFLDINMPELDGLGVLNILSHENSLQDLPVIVISAENNRERVDSLRANGVRGFIGKPFTPEQLRDIVLEVLEGTEGI